MTIFPASDRSLLVTFGNEISLESWRSVHHLTSALAGVRGILNLHPAFASVLIDFDPRLCDHQAVESWVRERLRSVPAEMPAPSRTIEISVRFGGEAGPDLPDVARNAGLTAPDAVELFTSTVYLVYFVGFSTCFPYLGGLPAELAMPRLGAPRKHVPEGSVAIGGAQAGVYPLASPGGWRLIGRTPLRLFDPHASPPALLRMGDQVRFRAEHS